MDIQRLSQSHRRRIFGGYYTKVLGYAPIAYWPLWEPSGSTAHCLINTAQNGSCTGVTQGQPGIGDGNICPLYDGINDYCDIYRTTLASFFSGTEGTMFIWAKVSAAGVWTDSTTRAMFRFTADSDNYVQVVRLGANDNAIRFRYEANNVAENVDVDNLSYTDFMAIALSWSLSADELKAYLNGTQQGSTQTSLGTWQGSLSSATLGATNTSPSTLWSGYLAHAALFDYVLPAASILDLSTL